MSSEIITFNKDNLNKYLSELAKRYRKISGGRIRAEIILIGGASVLVNYGFRDSTSDMDAIILAASCMQEAIYYVAEKHKLPDKWLNADFKRTTSYSQKLIQFSEHYKTFSNIMDVRTIRGEYLLAMKLVSGRKYKNDLSDIIGIVKDERNKGNTITMEKLNAAMEDLYGGWDNVTEELKAFADKVLSVDNIDDYFNAIRANEIKTREEILQFREDNPEDSKRKTANEILEELKKKERTI